MKTGDSALIDLIRVGDTTPYCTVLLKGVDEAGTTVSQQIALYPGKWKAVESVVQMFMNTREIHSDIFRYSLAMKVQEL